MRLVHSCALGRPWALSEVVVEWTDARTGGRWVSHLPERGLPQPPTKWGMVTVSLWGTSMGVGKYTPSAAQSSWTGWALGELLLTTG